jgi:RNA polymerase sigma factor (TIGR02999 family)
LSTVGPAARTSSVTALLRAWREGNKSAYDRLTPLVYDELRRRARHYLRAERPNHTLTPTALVNEVYLRMVRIDQVEWSGRAHFLAVAARQMRRILVDSARARRYAKRGGGLVNVTLDEAMAVANRDLDVVALDDALEALAVHDARKVHVVELRFFGGLTNEEIAAALGVSTDTVMRDWRLAKLWLQREMKNRRG